jgi:pSer/pThr/pTyr-binding forkhead associated (FHA) protein
MAISMRRPWLLATSKPEGLPPILQHASRLEYANDEDLRERLAQYVLSLLYPAKFAATQGATAQLELPFWLQLEDWIARFNVQTSRAMEGALQLLLIEEGQLKQRCRLTLNMAITAGRDPECDLGIETQGASRFHADFLLTGQGLFVVDRHSTNGTFVNGNRVPSDEQVNLEIGDRVRIGPAEVIIWDEDELPEEFKQFLPETGRIVPQTIFVNLADGLVLVDGKVPVACLSSSEINLLEFMHQKGPNITITSEIAEIIYGTGRVSRMIVASFIDGLRAKIEPSPSKPRFLVAVPGTGYRLRTRGGQLILRPR